MAELKVMEKEIEKNRKLVNEIEIQNRPLILLNKKNLKPILDKAHRQLNLKKKKIDQLQRQLQASEEEIIHI
jgi:hypothetical protein